MNQQTDPLWAALLKNKIVTGEPPQKTEAESPWFVKLLMAFSGWLAALFLLFFIGLGFKFIWKNEVAALMIGASMITGAWFILRVPKNEFLEHMGLAISLAGQFLVLYAIFETANGNTYMAWFLIGLFQLALALLMPGFIHRVFSSFGGALSFYLCIGLLNWPDIISGILMLSATFCWVNEFKWPGQIRRIRAIGYGLVLALILIKCTNLFGSRVIGIRFPVPAPGLWGIPLIETILTGAAGFYLVYHLLNRYNKQISEPVSLITLSGVILFSILSIKVEGLPAGLIIILLGFYGSNRVLLGLGIASLLFYISSYYYLLTTTLLDKSLSLFIVGLCLLITQQAMRRILPTETEVPHE